MIRRDRLWLAGLLVLFLLLVAGSWVGFIASDDVTYAHGAYGWIEHFPFVGGHGTIRYPITIPMALSFTAFGGNSFAMVLPSLLYMLGFLGLAFALVRRQINTPAAVGALLLLVTSPLLVIQSSIASVDIVEMSLLFLSFFLLYRRLEGQGGAKSLYFAGVAAGIAFLTRETAIFSAVFFGLLFLAGYRIPRAQYLLVAAGFLSVWALEIAYLWIMTGDPLYRINISLHHDSSIDRSVDLAGNVIVNPLVDPLLVLLLNQEFMLLFFVAIPMTVWLCFGHGTAAGTQRLARLLALFGLCWFVCVAAVQHLLPLNPRYFMITAAIACILTGIGLAALYERHGKRLVASILMCGLIGANAAGIAVENKQPQFGERTLAAIAAARPGVRIATDPMTRYRADMLLKWEGAQSRVTDTPPKPGALYFYNPKYAETANFKMPETARPAYQPQPGWRQVSRYEAPRSWLAAMIEGAGLSSILPPSIWHKLRHQHPPVTLYITPPPSSRGTPAARDAGS